MPPVPGYDENEENPALHKFAAGWPRFVKIGETFSGS